MSNESTVKIETPSVYYGVNDRGHFITVENDIVSEYIPTDIRQQFAANMMRVIFSRRD